MITTGEAPADGRRVFRIAVAGSVLVHLLGLLVALVASDGFHRLVARVDVARRTPPKDEIVTISSAIRFEKRARPVASRASRPRPVPVPPRPPNPQRPPAPERRPRAAREPRPVLPADVRLPVYREPPLLRHELAKTAPQAPPQPSLTRKGPQSARTPQPVRTPQPASAQQPARTQPATTPARTRPATTPARAPQRVASVPVAGEAGRGAEREREAAAAASAATLSQERIDQIERDLAKTIAQARAQANPLRAPREPPAAPKRYKIDMAGSLGTLRHGQGYYYPIKSWRAGGLDYYYVSYEYTYPDGTYETGSVPWPIHFAPAGDPFARDDLGLLRRTPLPGPPAGFVPPGTLGKALRAYFPELHFEDGS